MPNETGPYTNSDFVRDHGRASALKMRRWGRITGFSAVYRQRDPTKGSLPGVLAFGANVAVYRTVRGAAAALADPESGCRQKGFTVIPVAGHRAIGPGTLVCTKGAVIRRLRVRIFLVVWRNSRATGGVDVMAAEGAVTPVAALTGARKQDRRMTAELRD
ncbi:MAG TPA: hypothetical protein VFG93_04800 [Gaiellaceae bacterium]|nr:hypothetical protein [Gaiellaceae bacterium]